MLSFLIRAVIYEKFVSLMWICNKIFRTIKVITINNNKRISYLGIK